MARTRSSPAPTPWSSWTTARSWRSPTAPASGVARRPRRSGSASLRSRTSGRPLPATCRRPTTAASCCATSRVPGSWRSTATRSTSRSRPGSTWSWPTGCSRCARSTRPGRDADEATRRARTLDGRPRPRRRRHATGSAPAIASEAAAPPARTGRGRRPVAGPGRARRGRRRATPVDAAAERLGGLDHVVCTAGVLRIGRIADTGAADLAEVIDVNLTGTLNVARAAYPAPAREPRLVDRLRVELVHGRPAALRGLLGQQGRGGQPGPGPGRGMGRRRDPGQRGQPGADRYADAPAGLSGRGPRAGC